MQDTDTAAEAVIDYVAGHVMAEAQEHTVQVLHAVRATGAACTVVAGYMGNVTVWAGDDADRLADVDGIRLVRCHVGCSAHCTCDAEDGTDVPKLERATWMAIDTNGDHRATVLALRGAGLNARESYRALGMYRGEALPSVLARVHGATDVLRAHAALRDAGTGYRCAAVLAG